MDHLEILKEINKHIKYKRANTFLNHLKTILRFDSLGYSGLTNDNEFQIWRYSTWSGAFYPVIYGRIEMSDSNYKVRLKTRLNIVGILLNIIIIGGWSYAMIAGVIIQDNNSWNYIWKKILAALLILALLILIFQLSYQHEKKTELNRIKELINKVVAKSR